MEGLGLFKGQKITSSSRLIDIGVFTVNDGEWEGINDEQPARNF